MFTLRFMVMALASKKNTCKKTGVSATRDVGDEIVCAAMRVLLLCTACVSRRSTRQCTRSSGGIRRSCSTYHPKSVKTVSRRKRVPILNKVTIVVHASIYQPQQQGAPRVSDRAVFSPTLVLSSRLAAEALRREPTATP